jgi:hypothetical protein
MAWGLVFPREAGIGVIRQEAPQRGLVCPEG